MNFIKISRNVRQAAPLLFRYSNKNQFSLVPTRVSIETAKQMPKNYDELPNDVLLTMAIMGDQEAREERLIREIMSVDNVKW